MNCPWWRWVEFCVYLLYTSTQNGYLNTADLDFYIMFQKFIIHGSRQEPKFFLVYLNISIKLHGSVGAS